MKYIVQFLKYKVAIFRILLLIELKFGYNIWLEHDSEIQNKKILSHKQIRVDL